MWSPPGLLVLKRNGCAPSRTRHAIDDFDERQHDSVEILTGSSVDRVQRKTAVKRNTKRCLQNLACFKTDSSC